jgi:hypothetical protein
LPDVLEQHGAQVKRNNVRRQTNAERISEHEEVN